jgi:hypothetical protein
VEETVVLEDMVAVVEVSVVDDRVVEEVCEVVVGVVLEDLVVLVEVPVVVDTVVLKVPDAVVKVALEVSVADDSVVEEVSDVELAVLVNV